MASNAQYSMYTNVPTIQISRSRQNLSHHVKGSTNMGDLRPFYIQEVYAGDTIKCKTNFQCRLANSLTRPLLDNMFIDTYYFFVPHRLAYEHWEQVMGDNSKSSWIPQETFEFPVTHTSQTVVKNSLADNFGLPLGKLPKGIQLAPFRDFALIYNEWFRDQNVIDPVYVHSGEPTQSEEFNGNAWSSSNYMGMPPKVSKFHDRYTSALPSPQKGEPVLVSLNGFIPLDTAVDAVSFNSGNNLAYLFDNGIESNGVYNFNLAGNTVVTQGGVGQFDVTTNSASSVDGNGALVGTNLGVDLSANGTGITVNDLRLAFATQRLLERSATYGTRYREILRAAFGVDSPDARLQVPEFLGGKRSQLNVAEIWQTSSTSNVNAGGLDDFLASSAAYSKTNESNGFTKSFVEHGYVIGVYCIRQHHNYTQGIEKFWSRKDRLDFYDPAFANIGFQPIYQSELFANGDLQDTIGDDSDNVFGYTEAWYDLRTRVNYVTGDLRPSSESGLDIYTLADYYSEPPVLSQEFLEETPLYLDRALTVGSSTHNQFILDFYHTVSAIRPLPVRSIPTDLGGEHR